MKKKLFFLSLIFSFVVGFAFAYIPLLPQSVAKISPHDAVFEAVVHEVAYCPEVQALPTDIVAGFVNNSAVIASAAKNITATNTASTIKATDSPGVDVVLKTYNSVNSENNTTGASAAANYQEKPWQAWCQS